MSSGDVLLDVLCHVQQQSLEIPKYDKLAYTRQIHHAQNMTVP